jgi:hypothetical protein
VQPDADSALTVRRDDGGRQHLILGGRRQQEDHGPDASEESTDVAADAPGMPAGTQRLSVTAKMLLARTAKRNPGVDAPRRQRNV